MGVKITGIQEVINTMQIIARADWLEKPMNETVEYGKKLLKEYPPPPTGSRYIRTYTYRDSIYGALTRRGAGGITGRVYSVGAVQRGRQYEQYVKVRENQAQIHQGRWTVYEDDAVKIEEYGVGQFVKAAQEVTR